MRRRKEEKTRKEENFKRRNFKRKEAWTINLFAHTKRKL